MKPKILKCTGQLRQQRIIQTKMSTTRVEKANGPVLELRDF